MNIANWCKRGVSCWTAVTSREFDRVHRIEDVLENRKNGNKWLCRMILNDGFRNMVNNSDLLYFICPIYYFVFAHDAVLWFNQTDELFAINFLERISIILQSYKNVYKYAGVKICNTNSNSDKELLNIWWHKYCVKDHMIRSFTRSTVILKRNFDWWKAAIVIVLPNDCNMIERLNVLFILIISHV